MAETPRISEAEWDVMRVIWERHPLTAQEVARILGPQKGWSPRTVKTMLSRLVKKGALEFELEGQRYLYSPRVSRDQCVREESRSFARRVFDGETSPLMAYFLRESQLSPEEIRELRRLLDEKEADQ